MKKIRSKKYVPDPLCSFLLFLLLSGITFSQTSLINTAHLDHLYEDVTVNGRKVGIIHIYANAPTYDWTGDEDEGIACVDDAARAAIFYLKQYQKSLDAEHLRKGRQLLEFLLAMQADSGFYNFIFEDMKVNKTGITSKASSNWWTWRAMWAISAGYDMYSTNSNPAYDGRMAKRLRRSLVRAYPLIKQLMDRYPRTEYKGDMRLPGWLPFGNAADQTAVILKVLVPMYEKQRDATLEQFLRHFSEGIMMMQKGDEKQFPYYALMSWENTWHAWGCNQAEALLRAGISLRDDNIIQSALKEIENFYPYLIKEGFLSSFSVVEGKPSELKKFPQIAYGFSPMLAACALAKEYTGDEKYDKIARDIALWFAGKNAIGRPMYDPSTGRGYDGINDENTLNMNSGAESTIEALFALQDIENNYYIKEAVMMEYK